MNAGQPDVTIREAVGVFTDAQAFQTTIDELMTSGFDRADLSLLASEKTVAEKLGHHYRNVTELEDDGRIPRRDYVSAESIGDAKGGLISGLLYVGAVAAATPIIAAGGPLAVAIVAAAVGGGAGSMLGGVLAKLVGDRHARYLQEQLDHGGLLLWVRTWAPDRERRAVEILSKHSGSDVHVHTLQGLMPEEGSSPAASAGSA